MNRLPITSVCLLLLLVFTCFQFNVSAQKRHRHRKSTVITHRAIRHRSRHRTRRTVVRKTATRTTKSRIATLADSSEMAAAGTPCAATLASCPMDGCGGAGMDRLLNHAKNRVTAPAVATLVNLSLDDIRNLNQPDTWQTNRDRAELQGAMREDQPVRVMGYLWKAKREHGESCNCGLDAPGLAGELLTDIHLVLTDRLDDPEATSVTAEITPRVRANRSHPETWAQSRITSQRGKFIRVTGYLMLDTEHLIRNPLVRATNWEVHPIMKLEVCTRTEAQCRAGNGWRNVP